MAISFVDPAPKAVVVEDIVVGGVKVGEVKINPPSQHRKEVSYHASIKLDLGLDFFTTLGLIQGHGATRDAAVMEAICKGKTEALALLAAIADLEGRLGEREE